MNWLLVFIESLVWCAFFTIMMITLAARMKIKKDYSLATDYPPEIVERLVEQGKLKKEEKVSRGKMLVKKIPALIFYLAFFSCLLYFINGCRPFITGFLSSLIIMLVWTWYDALVLDCLIFVHTKLFVVEGTEDMTEAYHNYWFHIKASLVGTVLSVIGSLAIGGIIALISNI